MAGAKNRLKKFNWPLGISTMTLVDKAKISKFLFTEKVWTAGKYVEDYERMWSEHCGCPYVVAVSSGSAANFAIALRRKMEVEELGIEPGQGDVLFNATNWISSVSPFVHVGFNPVFVDIGDNLCPTAEQIAKKLEENPWIHTVFYTTLLGFSAPIEDLLRVCDEYGVKLYLDNCESSFSEYDIELKDGCRARSYFNNITTSSTSCYISHFTSGSNELGLIFCQDEEEYDWYRMIRNHGMTRNMPEKYRNPSVDPSFDFYSMGTNLRSSNLLCYMASLDFARSAKFTEENRSEIETVFQENLDSKKFANPHVYVDKSLYYRPLAIPIVKNRDYDDPYLIGKVKNLLSFCGIGYRPVVGGNLLRHNAFKSFGRPEDYPNSQYIHDQAVYVGLHQGVTRAMAEELAGWLSDL